MTILPPFVTFFWPKNIKLDQNKPKFVNSKKRKKTESKEVYKELLQLNCKKISKTLSFTIALSFLKTIWVSYIVHIV